MTTQALSELLERGIDLALYTRHGRLKGHLVSAVSKNAGLRVAQLRTALDLLEAFRAPCIDRLTLRLLNERVLTAGDFARRVSRPAGGVVLVPEAFQRYLEHYETAVREPRPAAPEGFRAAFQTEAEKLRGWLRDGGSFVPYLEA